MHVSLASQTLYGKEVLKDSQGASSNVKTVTVIKCSIFCLWGGGPCLLQGSI